ncbi:MAG: hypothetical protein ACPGQI_02180 [Gammaproteobacteria bacterium]
MVRFSKSRRSRASRSSRSNLSYLLVGTVGALSGSLVFALATIAFLLATQPLPPKDNSAADGTQTLRAEEQAEVDFRQIVARSAELQLSPDVHRASRVSAYRMLTADGSIHTMVRHNNQKLYGGLMLSRRSRGAFEIQDVKEEVVQGWSETVLGGEAQALEWRNDSEVITTMGRVKLAFFDRKLTEGRERCVGYLGKNRSNKRRLSGFLCNRGEDPIEWDHAVRFLEHVEISGRRVII